jgi:hypothetical protein
MTQVQQRRGRGRTRGPASGGPRPSGTQAIAAANVLHQQSLWLFAAFAVAMFVAFWPSYFSRLGLQETYHPHAHGLSMALWCAMLVAQASLIRSGNRRLHRKVGRLSYVLVPLMVVSTVNFISFRLQGVPQPTPFILYFLALIINALVAFLVLYALAMFYRRQPAIHARYMVSTLFPLFTPVTDRLIGRFLPSLVPMVPRIDGSPVLPFAGFVLADVMLTGLCIWDWRVNKRTDVFPVALVVLVLYHVSVMTFHRLPAWASFGAWFVTLPLS